MNQNMWSQFRRGKPAPTAGAPGAAASPSPANFSMSNGAPLWSAGGASMSRSPAPGGGSPNPSPPMWSLSSYEDGGVIEDENQPAIPDGTQMAALSTPETNTRPNIDKSGIKTKLDYRNRGMEIQNDNNPQNFRHPFAQGNDPTTEGVQGVMGIVNQVLMFGRNKYGMVGGGDDEELDGAGAADDTDVTAPLTDADQEPLEPAIPETAAPTKRETRRERWAREQAELDAKSKGPQEKQEPGLIAQGAMALDQNMANADAKDDAAGVSQYNPSRVLRPAARKLMQLISGADAAPSNIVQKLEQSVGANNPPDGAVPDGTQPAPQGSPDETKAKAVAKAMQTGGPEAAWGVAQNYRQKYDHYRAFALQALQGTQQKPGNMGAAANAANQMYSNMLDGYSLKFQPSNNGVTVTVSQMGSPRPIKAFSVDMQNFKKFLSDEDGQYDNVLKKGIMNVMGGLEPERASFDTQSMARQRAINPTNEQAQAAGALTQENLEAKNQNAVDVAAEKGKNTLEAARIRADAGKENVALKYTTQRILADQKLAQQNREHLDKMALQYQKSGDTVRAKMAHEAAQPTFDPKTFQANYGQSLQDFLKSTGANPQGNQPAQAAPQAQQPGAAQQVFEKTATNPKTGQKIGFKDGKWVDAKTGQPVQ